MSAPEAWTVKTPAAYDALPATPTAPISASTQGGGRPPVIGVGVTVGVRVAVAVEVRVAVAVAVCVIVDVRVAVRVGVALPVAVGVDVRVAVGVGVIGVGVRVAVEVPVTVRVGVRLGVLVWVAVRVAVGVTVGVDVAVRVAVAVGVRVAVGVIVAVGVRVGVEVGVGVAPPLKTAVKVVLVAGVEMSCVWAPPSDQETNVLEPCGEGAPRVRVMFTTLVTVAGAVTGWPSMVSCSPDGLVASVIVERFGMTSTYFSSVRPEYVPLPTIPTEPMSWSIQEPVAAGALTLLMTAVHSAESLWLVTARPT
jgi:hypothetical protein